MYSNQITLIHFHSQYYLFLYIYYVRYKSYTMLKKDGGMKWWNHFQSTVRYPRKLTKLNPCSQAVLHTHHQDPGVKSLSSNLYDGFKSLLRVFDSICRWACAVSLLVTFIRITLLMRFAFGDATGFNDIPILKLCVNNIIQSCLCQYCEYRFI